MEVEKIRESVCFDCKEKFLPFNWGNMLCPRCYFLDTVRTATRDIGKITERYMEKTEQIVKDMFNE